VEVISSAKYLHVVPVRDQSLSDLIYLLGFLRLTTSLAEYDIAFNIEPGSVGDIPLNPYKAGFLCMLEVVPMTLGNLAVNSLFDPCNFINKSKKKIKTTDNSYL
jgi:hypothetical protein